MIKLKRLRIGKYRNVAPGTELVFSDGFNILLGPNGTGKTTLLKLIVMLLKSDFSPLQGEEFEFECSLVSQPLVVGLYASNQRRAVGDSEKSLVAVNKQFEWSFRLTLQFVDPVGTYVITSNEFGTRLTSDGGLGAEVPLSIISVFEETLIATCLAEAVDHLADEHKHAAAAVAVVQLVSLGNNLGRFDEALGAFLAMTGGATGDEDESQPPAASFRIDTTKESSRLGTWFFYVPTERKTLVGSIKNPPLPERLALSPSDTPFLRQSIELLGFSDAQGIFLLKRKEQAETGETADYGELRISLTFDDGSIITHDYLSYGQKRLLSFFYYLAANPHVVIADELVNGMHHEWIRACLDAIGSRQAFLTSQNPLLLDCLPTFTSPDDVQRCFILCGREKREKRSYMTWKNMGIEEAESFFRAYEAGIQHVGDILRTKGLW